MGHRGHVMCVACCRCMEFTFNQGKGSYPTPSKNVPHGWKKNILQHKRHQIKQPVLQVVGFLCIYTYILYIYIFIIYSYIYIYYITWNNICQKNPPSIKRWAFLGDHGFIPPKYGPRPQAFDGHIGWRNDDLERSLWPKNGECFHRSKIPFPPGVSGDGNGEQVISGNGKDPADPGFWEAGVSRGLSRFVVCFWMGGSTSLRFLRLLAVHCLASLIHFIDFIVFVFNSLWQPPSMQNLESRLWCVSKCRISIFVPTHSYCNF